MYLILILASLLSGALHDFHVSITQGEYNSKTGTLQVYMKIFTDDLENAIEDITPQRLQLGSADEYVKTDSLIENYVLRHFWMKNDGEKLDFQFIGKETEQDIVFVYLEVPLRSGVKQLTVSNTLFFDRFDDQANIVNIELNGHLESAFLERSAPVKTLRFD